MKKLTLLVSFLFLVATAAFANYAAQSSSKGNADASKKAQMECEKKEGYEWKKVWNADKTKEDWKCVVKEKAKSSDSDADDSSDTDDTTETE